MLDDVDAIDAFIVAHPATDRAVLARAIAAARAERGGGGPPRAYRELFKLLRRAAGDDDAATDSP